MGARKRISAEARKEAQKTMYFAKLNNCFVQQSQTGNRKMNVKQKQESYAYLQSALIALLR